MANKKVSQLTSKPSVLTTDLFPIADPSTGQLFKTTISDLGTAIGSGVSSVNGLVGAVVLDTDDIQELVSPTNKWFTDTRARASLSASSPLTYNSGTGAFGIQVATGSQNGYLSSADWTTFNAKQAALSGTGFVKSTGGTISYDTNTYLTTSAAASTYLALAGGTMTGALFGASASFSGYVGFNGNTSPLYPVDVAGSGRFSGDLRIESTNPRIYLTDTDNNPDYFISNTDGTFTIYDVTNSTARFTIGTTGNATFANAITGGGSITGTALYSTGIVSVGTSLSVGTFVSAGGSLTGSSLYVTGMTAGSGAIYHTGSRLTFANYNTSGTLHFEVNGGNGALTINSDTSASFVNTISATGATFTNTSGDTVTLSKGSGPTIKFSKTTTTAQDWALAGEGSAFKLYNYTASTTPFQIETNGATTFSRNDTANISITIANAFINQGNLIKFQQNKGGTTNIAYIGHGGDSTGNFIINNGNQALTITNAGAATFIGSISAGGNIETTSSYFLVANAYFGKASALFTGGSANDLGLMVSGANNLIFGNALTEKMRITSSGNVGIGTTSPASKLHIEGTGTGAWLTINRTDSGTNLVDYTQSGTRLGYIGYIGSELWINNATASDISIRTSGSERMRITSSGELNLGGTGQAFNSVKQQIWFAGSSSQYGLSIAALNVGSTRFIDFNIGSGSGGQAGSISWNGSVVSYNITSDYRLKEDLKSINGLEIVNKINVYDYKWKSNNSRMDGVLAHELQEVLPYAVTGIKDGEQMQSVDYSKIVPVMVQAIKDLKSELDTLKNK
jgi:hypothetical protein